MMENEEATSARDNGQNMETETAPYRNVEISSRYSFIQLESREFLDAVQQSDEC